jgi:hypothetical protein
VWVTSVYRSQAPQEISENDIRELVSNLALDLTMLGFKEYWIGKEVGTQAIARSGPQDAVIGQVKWPGVLHREFGGSNLFARFEIFFRSRKTSQNWQAH